jgi:hypothetical protein
MSKLFLTIFFPLYLLLLAYTNISFTGFWTDLLLTISLAIWALWLVIKNNYSKAWYRFPMRIIHLLCSLLVFGFLIKKITNPFNLNNLEVTSFYLQQVDGRFFNAYFVPVGSYSGGEGDLRITESPRYFPIIETEIYYKHAVLWNFKNDEWDGQKIDQYSILDDYIKTEIIAEPQ